MARTIAMRVQSGVAEEPAQNPIAAIDASLTSDDAYEQPDYAEVESSARLASVVEPAPLKRQFRAPAELVAMPGRPPAEGAAAVPAESPRYASRNWRAEAWDRERERELRAVERRPDISSRRKSGS